MKYILIGLASLAVAAALALIGIAVLMLLTDNPPPRNDD